MNIKVFLVDDHIIVREGLKTILNKEPDMEVTGEAKNGKEAIDKIHDCETDIIIMDIEMPGLDGIDTTKKIISEYGKKVLALSAHSEIHYVQKMLKAGAKGYLLKECIIDEISRAIHRIINGGIYISDKLTQNVVSDYVKRLSEVENSTLSILTKKEIEVIKLTAKGLSRKEIAHQLYTTASTVSTHRQNVMEKLGFSTMAELLMFAIREGIVSLD
ncbi:MAG: DNA-binding response regulator [Chlamydiae bacterium]|nr:MAG: DNA-binding response regulator [Chlamydiota bacterium]